MAESRQILIFEDFQPGAIFVNLLYHIPCLGWIITRQIYIWNDFVYLYYSTAVQVTLCMRLEHHFIVSKLQGTIYSSFYHCKTSSYNRFAPAVNNKDELVVHRNDLEYNQTFTMKIKMLYSKSFFVFRRGIHPNKKSTHFLKYKKNRS